MELYEDPRVNTNPVRPFSLPMPVTMTYPSPEGPFSVVSPVTHRIVGTCSAADRQWWIDAGYIVG